MKEPKDKEKEWGIALKKINEFRKTNKAGKITYRGGDFDIWEKILLTRINFDNRLPYYQREKILRDILFKARESNKISLNEVFVEAQKLENGYLKKNPSEFHMVTHLYLEKEWIRKSLQVQDVRVFFRPSIKKYDQDSILRLRERSKLEELNQRFRPILLKTEARCEYEAFNKMMEAYYLFRASLSLIINFESVTFFESDLGPLHNIAGGPLYTVHHPSGKPLRYWYDSDFNGKTKPQNLGKKVDSIKQLPAFLHKATQTSKLSKYASEALIRYIKALDFQSYSSAYLQLWSLLEFLTHTNQQNYDVTIKRASSIYADYDVSLYLFSSFRNIRNNFVHRFDDAHISRTAVDLLKITVEKHILNLIYNPYNVESMEEYGYVLELLKTNDSLRRKIKLIKIADKIKASRASGK